MSLQLRSHFVFANERLKTVSLRAQFSVKLRFLCHYWRSISLSLEFGRARAAVLCWPTSTTVACGSRSRWTMWAKCWSRLGWECFITVVLGSPTSAGSSGPLCARWQADLQLPRSLYWQELITAAAGECINTHIRRLGWELPRHMWFYPPSTHVQSEYLYPHIQSQTIEGNLWSSL